MLDLDVIEFKRRNWVTVGSEMDIAPHLGERAVVDGELDEYPKVLSSGIEECVAQAKRFGYVETIMKRRRPIPEIESTNPQRRAFAERTAINSVVQGSAADLIKVAMVDIEREIDDARAPKGLKMLLQIHDELVFECPGAQVEQAKALIVAKMEGAMTLSVPLRVDANAGANWFEGK